MDNTYLVWDDDGLEADGLVIGATTDSEAARIYVEETVVFNDYYVLSKGEAGIVVNVRRLSNLVRFRVKAETEVSFHARQI